MKRLLTLLILPILAFSLMGLKPYTNPTVCTVEGNEVTATGLPGETLINFLITDESGKSGWVLGFTDASVNYTWTVTVPDRTGPTLYEFVSKTWGSGDLNRAKYVVYSYCTAS